MRTMRVLILLAMAVIASLMLSCFGNGGRGGGGAVIIPDFNGTSQKFNFNTTDFNVVDKDATAEQDVTLSGTNGSKVVIPKGTKIHSNDLAADCEVGYDRIGTSTDGVAVPTGKILYGLVRVWFKCAGDFKDCTFTPAIKVYVPVSNALTTDWVWVYILTDAAGGRVLSYMWNVPSVPSAEVTNFIAMLEVYDPGIYGLFGNVHESGGSM